jgi:chloramphenicol-sensitive protein RarD
MIEGSKEKADGRSAGVLMALAAYGFWGAIPIYWKQIDHISALEVLSHRILWSLVMMTPVILLVPGLRTTFLREIRFLFRDGKTFILALIGSILISANWLTYIYAVNSNMIMESSLGYFLNPLLNVILAILFLKERLGTAGVIACSFALVGVGVITWDAGVAPWVALSLGVTFALYGLLKKKIQISSFTSLTVETLFMLPFVMIFLLFFSDHSMLVNSAKDNVFLVGAGLITAAPLLLFAEAAKRISYITIGFIQYISPTVNFFIAVFLYHEPLSHLKMVGFALIWVGILVYSFGGGLPVGRKSSLKNKSKRNPAESP